MNDDDVICYCFEVTVKDIKDAFENGATTVDEIEDITQAGSLCGACMSDIVELLTKLKNKESF